MARDVRHNESEIRCPIDSVTERARANRVSADGQVVGHRNCLRKFMESEP
jgi:hypothetical protein